MYIDTHAHLNNSLLKPYIPDIAASMSSDLLSAIVNVGWDVISSIEAINIAEKYENMYAIIGIHPHESALVKQEDYNVLKNLSLHEKVIAYGEIGLDFYHDHSPRDVQEKVFIEQLEIAHDLSMPVVLHVRDAFKLAYDTLLKYEYLLKNGIVLHCYSGSAEMSKMFGRFDSYFSFGGAITFKNSKKEGVISAIPKDRLLLETDCPYMTPVPYRGNLNFPKYIKYVAETIKDWLPGIDVGELTTVNAKTLFKKIKTKVG